MSLQWNELDERCVRMAKALSADAVEKAGSGHPGTPISLAPAAYLLYQRHLRFDPTDDLWLGRDKFILSAGHASLLQYIQLYYSGMGLTLADLKAFRTLGSLTPGHPEYRHTKGVEITTGPLGSGVGSAIGLAMSQRRLRGMMDPDAPAGESPFDHHIYCICGDGDLQEGMTHESCSLAGLHELGNLTMIWDDNHISIEDDTAVAFNEDVLERYRAYGWHVQRVDWLSPDGTYTEDVAALDRAILEARAHTDQPSLIALRTVIGWPAPTLQNTGAIHGAKLGTKELRGLKQALGYDPDQMFAIDQPALEHVRANAACRGRAARQRWNRDFAAWREAHPDRQRLLERMLSDTRPADFRSYLPTFPTGQDIPTRAASGQTINALAPVLPELWGGSADLGDSNKTVIKGAPSFIPPSAQTKMWKGNQGGRILHFGVREHGMGAILNGISLDGFSRVYGGTFFVFADYMRGSVRLAALMQLPVIYVWTHDSIGVGEDGPTHQPIEHLASYRAVPGLSVVRPADAAETAQAWAAALERGRREGPVALVLTRQGVPNPKRGGETGLAAAEGLKRGGYVLADAEGNLDVILLASGSEVAVALAARALLAREGIGARVVSMPCMEWFDAQEAAYRDSVLPPSVTARVSVEAGIAMPWLKYVGCRGRCVSIETFGAVGSSTQLFAHFGITPQAVYDQAKAVLDEAAEA